MSIELSKAQPPPERLRRVVSFTWAWAPLVALGAGCGEPLCSTAEIPDAGSALGSDAFAGRVTEQDLFDSSCGLAGAPESAFSWSAPSSGRYRFDTTGSELDTILSVRTGDACGGAEVTCNDDSNLEFSSEVEVWLEAGEAVYVVVEGYQGSTGAFVVNIRELVEAECSGGADDDDDGLIDCEDPDCDCTCPDDMLPAQPEQPTTGTTEGARDASEGSCGGFGAPDTSLVWTPPSTGRYRIDTEGSGFDTVLYVRAGDACDGAELACNDDQTFGGYSAVELRLTGGEPVVVTVDGYDSAGDYVLNIEKLTELDCTDGTDEDEDGAMDCDDADCDCTCPLESLGSALGARVYAGSTARRGDLGAGSCGGDGAADASFVWTAPEAGLYRIDTAGSSFDTVLYVQQGDVCGGAELACNDDTEGSQSQVELDLVAGQSVVITVDGFGGEAGSFDLSIECLTCL